MTNRPTWTTITITHLGRKGLNVKPALGQKEFSQMSDTSKKPRHTVTLRT